MPARLKERGISQRDWDRLSPKNRKSALRQSDAIAETGQALPSEVLDYIGLGKAERSEQWPGSEWEYWQEYREAVGS